MEKVTIRRMTKDDVENIMKVEESAYGEHHWSKDSFMSELSNDLAKYFVLYNEENVLCGYAGCWQIFEEAHITNIAVSPDYRRRHYAEALLKKIIDACYENMVKYLTLEVRVSNSAAISLYEKYGFKSLGTRKAYYQNNNEDALIMWTENIFYDKFKNIYDKNMKLLGEKIIINE
ncbi:ribosomal protein S18-alanine N-acetyltransferase [bacterium]|nr:ribosomal protein S18-alanine N-acetyltransferase [bacterium]